MHFMKITFLFTDPRPAVDKRRNVRVQDFNKDHATVAGSPGTGKVCINLFGAIINKFES